MEPVTAPDHAVLDWRGRSDAISRVRRRRRVADDRHARPRLRPETGAARPCRRVPGRELLQRNAVRADDGVAALPDLDEVELIAVVDHTGLDGRRRRDAVARGCRRGRVADDGDADVRIKPETGARGATDVGVPREKLGHRNTALGGDGLAAITALYEVEGVTVVYHAWLCRLGSLDTARRDFSNSVATGLEVKRLTDLGER